MKGLRETYEGSVGWQKTCIYINWETELCSTLQHRKKETALSTGDRSTLQDNIFQDNPKEECTPNKLGMLKIPFQHYYCKAQKLIWNKKSWTNHELAVINHRGRLLRLIEVPPAHIFEDMNRIIATIPTATIAETNVLMHIITTI